MRIHLALALLTAACAARTAPPAAVAVAPDMPPPAVCSQWLDTVCGACGGDNQVCRSTADKLHICAQKGTCDDNICATGVQTYRDDPEAWRMMSCSAG